MKPLFIVALISAFLGIVTGDVCKFCIPSSNETVDVAAYDDCVAVLLCQNECAYENQTVKIYHPNSVVLSCDNVNLRVRHPFTGQLEDIDELCEPRCRDHTPSEELQKKKVEVKIDTFPSFLDRPTSVFALHMFVSFFIAAIVCFILIFKILKWIDTHHEDEQLLTEGNSLEEV